MGGERNPGREAHVRALTRLAQSNGLQGIAENSGRAKVSKLAEEILALDISQAVRKQVQRALDAYIATFGQAGQNVDASAAGAGADGGGAGAAPARALQSSATKVWKFMAVQLTYNSSHGDFASLEETVLRQLFSRFLAFLAGLARELKAEGTSATMEKASPLQVHLHAYLHLAQPFHRRGRDALQVFEFEGVRPHLSPNTTSGKGYMGAVRHGHFYVVVDKIGTLPLGWSCGVACLYVYRYMFRGLRESCGFKF